MVTVSGTATSRGFVSGTVFLYAGDREMALPEYTLPESKIGAELARYREARVATSDGIEQTLILGRGATRLSAREFWREVDRERADGRGRYTTHARSAKPSVGSGSLRSALSAEQFRLLDELRRQK